MRIRPHHLLCLQTWAGRGYSEAFTENMNRIAAKLREHPEEPVTLAAGADDICAGCPNLLADGRCRSEEKVHSYDAAVRFLLENAATDQPVNRNDLPPRPYRELDLQVRASFGISPVPGICGDCEWYDLCREVAGK